MDKTEGRMRLPKSLGMPRRKGRTGAAAHFVALRFFVCWDLVSSGLASSGLAHSESCLPVRMPAQMLACLPAQMLACLLAQMLACLLAWLLARRLAWLPARQPACQPSALAAGPAFRKAGVRPRHG